MDDVSKRLDDLEERVKRLEEKASVSVDTDTLLSKAKEIISKYDEVSASLLQRRLSIGYSRAARLLGLLEEEGLVGKGEGSNPREVLKKSKNNLTNRLHK